MVDPAVLASVIEGSSLSYRKSANSYIFTCPRCEKKDKLYIRKSDGRFVCFYCATIDNYYGKPEIALADLLGQPLSEVKELLYGAKFSGHDAAHLRLDLIDFYADPPDKIFCPPSLPERCFPLDFYPIDHKFAKPGLEYLDKRGIPLNIAQFYNIYYHPITKRVIFPVISDGKLLGWQGRSIQADTRIKILSSPDLKRDSTLMFSNNLKGSQHAIITEGPVDAIKCHLCSGAVATMGKIISQTQVDIIKNSGVSKIYVALDPDASFEIETLVKKFHEFETYLMQPPPNRKDLGECTFDEAFQCWINAKKVNSAHLFCYLKNHYA